MLYNASNICNTCSYRAHWTRAQREDFIPVPHAGPGPRGQNFDCVINSRTHLLRKIVASMDSRTGQVDVVNTSISSKIVAFIRGGNA
jgi:hypothetical protein